MIAKQQCKEGVLRVDGLVTLSDFERVIGLSLPQKLNVKTVSGLIMLRLNRMPEPGDEIKEGNYRLRVLNLVDRRVGSVEIHRLNRLREFPVIDSDNK